MSTHYSDRSHSPRCDLTAIHCKYTMVSVTTTVNQISCCTRDAHVSARRSNPGIDVLDNYTGIFISLRFSAVTRDSDRAHSSCSNLAATHYIDTKVETTGTRTSSCTHYAHVTPRGSNLRIDSVNINPDIIIS